MTPRHYSIYKVEVPDGRAYIGCTSVGVEERWLSHGYARPHEHPGSLATAIGQFGKDACTIAHIASATNPEDAAWIEEELIRQHNTMAPNGCNLRAGSSIRGNTWRRRYTRYHHEFRPSKAAA